jgi:RNA polymerase sigma-54 factor
MRQGLSLRVSQHLALTPQLQQSIRLLQLSTLELSSEVDQMLDDNPFLEREATEAPREDFGLEQADVPVRGDDLEAESAAYSGADYPAETRAVTENDASTTNLDDDGPTTANGVARPAPRATTSMATTPLTRPSWRARMSRCKATCTPRRCRCAWGSMTGLR